MGVKKSKLFNLHFLQLSACSFTSLYNFIIWLVYPSGARFWLRHSGPGSLDIPDRFFPPDGTIYCSFCFLLNWLFCFLTNSTKAIHFKYFVSEHLLHFLIDFFFFAPSCVYFTSLFIVHCFTLLNLELATRPKFSPVREGIFRSRLIFA